MEHPFYVGQKVVCIDATGLVPASLKKGQTYTITSIAQSPCCKQLVIGVGLDPIDGTDYTRCNICKNLYKNIAAKDHHFRASRFIPLPEEEFQQITYTKILEEMPIGAN